MQTPKPSNPLKKTFSQLGSPDEIFEYEYDENGKRNKASVDTDGDGIANFTLGYEYDANGNQTQEFYDYNGDGAANRIDLSEYDANGNLTKKATDDKADGVLTNVEEYKYDANNNQIELSSDANGDGEPESISKFEYNADGNQSKKSYDYNGDGEIDDVHDYSYKLDSQGNVIEASYDNTGDGEPESITTYAYDANGNQTKVSTDSDVDGTPDSVIQYEYDDSNRLTKESVDSDGDGITEKTTTYSYIADTDPSDPDVTDPVTDGPDVVDPDVTDPDVIDPDVTVTDPDVVDPDVTDPDVVDPVTDGPDVVDPDVTNPDVVDPVIDGPVTDGPDVVDPVTDGPVIPDGPVTDGLDVVDPIVGGPVVVPNADSSMRLSFEDFGLRGAGELRVFSLAEDGSKTQIASFFTIDGSKLANGYSSDLSIDSSQLSAGEQLQFELVENGSVRTGTLDFQDNMTSVINFGNNARLVVASVDEAAAPNLLRGDATTIDLTGFDSGSDVALNFSVYREASYDNTLCFYSTDDVNGGILDSMTGEMLQPGDDGYMDAAISRQMDLELTAQNGEVATFSGNMTGGGFIGMFLISDGSDAASGDVLFSSLGANGGNDYAKMLGNNTFGFEDTVGLGDQDFNDMVVKIELA